MSVFYPAERIRSDRSPLIHWVIAGLLLALGLAMRVWGAWVYEFAHTSDHGIICLMVKHMLEGRGFPVFFYGHSYMGNLEPAFSALLCRGFGLTGFWINMGTALIGFAFLPLVYVWARKAAGSVAALAALAFAVIGPPDYFQFVSWADGGYAAIPFLICAVVMGTLWLLERELRDRPPPFSAYAALGLVAGVGCWQSPLLIPAFATSALLGALVLRHRVLSWRSVAGAIGFFIGSAPLWIWNIRNGWQTFDMVKTHERPGIVEGLKIFYGERLPTLLELSRLPVAAQIALGSLLLLLTAAGLARLYQSEREGKRSETLWLGGGFLFLLLYSSLFGFSRFARVDAMRYVIVLIPVLGVLWGAGTAWLFARLNSLGRAGQVAAFVPVSLLILLQALELPKRLEQRRVTAAFMDEANALGDFLRSNGIRHLYADYQVRRANHALNFILNEEFVFSPPLRERYTPYAEALEGAEHPAVLNNCMGFQSFLEMTGGSSQTGDCYGMTVHFNIQPPPPAVPLPASFLREIQDESGRDWHSVLTDGDAGTSWSEEKEGEQKLHRLTLRLCEAVVLSGVRCFAEESRYPSALAVEGWDAAAQKWRSVAPLRPVTRYFWSGPRFYWGGDLYRLECRFSPLETDQLRLTVKGGRETPFSILELEILTNGEDAGQKRPDRADLEPAARHLQSSGIRRLYADRWEANILWRRCNGELQTPWLRHLKRSACLTPAMTLDRQTAILVREEYSESVRRALARRFIESRETPVGIWRLFDFSESPTPSALLDKPGLWWTGLNVLCSNDEEWAVAVVRSADEWVGRKEAARAMEALRSTLAVFPYSAPFYRVFAETAEQAGDFQTALAARLAAERAGTPSVVLDARFHGGPELAGVTLSERGVIGEILPVRYHWRGLQKSNLENLEVRVRFQRGDEMVFQDDHSFPSAASQVQKDWGEWVEERRVRIPNGLSPGEVRMVIELARIEGKSRRLPVTAAHREGKRAVVVPVPIRLVRRAAEPVGDAR